MSDKENKVVEEVKSDEFAKNDVVVPKLVGRLPDTDVLALELAKTNKKLAYADAQTALEKHKLAELNYRYLILQLYMRNGLTEKDGIDENGNILYDGAVGK